MHVSSFHLSLCYSTSNYFDTLSLHDALPIYLGFDSAQLLMSMDNDMPTDSTHRTLGAGTGISSLKSAVEAQGGDLEDRKSTRLNSSHVAISYAVFCLKKKTTLIQRMGEKI